MATGKKPDFRVMFPLADTSGNGKDNDTKTVWHRHGAAWKRDGGSIGIVLDIGVPLNYPPGAQLVLVEAREDGRVWRWAALSKSSRLKYASRRKGPRVCSRTVNISRVFSFDAALLDSLQ